MFFRNWVLWAVKFHESHFSSADPDSWIHLAHRVGLEKEVVKVCWDVKIGCQQAWVLSHAHMDCHLLSTYFKIHLHAQQASLSQDLTRIRLACCSNHSVKALPQSSRLDCTILSNSFRHTHVSMHLWSQVEDWEQHTCCLQNCKDSRLNSLRRPTTVAQILQGNSSVSHIRGIKSINHWESHPIGAVKDTMSALEISFVGRLIRSVACRKGGR